MKKYLSLLLIIILIFSIIVGCSQKSDEAKEVSSHTSSKAEVQMSNNNQQVSPDDILLMLGKTRSDVEASFGPAAENDSTSEYPFESYDRIKYENYTLFLDENNGKVYGIIFNEGINGIKSGMKTSELEDLSGTGTKKIRGFAETEIPLIEYLFDNYKVASTGKTLSLALQAYLDHEGNVFYVMAVTREYADSSIFSKPSQENDQVNDEGNSVNQNKKRDNNYDSALNLLGVSKEQVVEVYGDGEYVDYGESEPFMRYKFDGHELRFYFDYGETGVEKVSLLANLDSEKPVKASINGIALGMKTDEVYAKANDKITKKGQAEEVTYEYTVYKINGYDTAIDEIDGIVTGISIEAVEKETAEVSSEETLSSDDNALIESNGTNYYKYKSNTTVHFDIDEDGTDEEIVYDTENGKLKVAGYEAVNIDTMFAEKEYFVIIKYSDKFDHTMNMIGALDYGPSMDLVTTLYSIIAPQGKKWFGSVGEVTGEIVTPSNFNKENMDDFNYKAVLYENRGIEATVRLSIIEPFQTWFGRNYFTYYATYCSLIDNINKYGRDYETNIELKIEKDVLAYSEKDTSSDSLTIKGGQKVHFIATDNKEWIKMKAEDETVGWVNAKDVTESNFSGFTVFD